MAIIKSVFVDNELYHIYTRGVEKRDIFMDEVDYCRFVHNLVFVLMPNHFHLLLRQKEEHGISRFMQKLGTGYTNYFNIKHERVGGLFQGKFKAVLVNEDRLMTN